MSKPMQGFAGDIDLVHSRKQFITFTAIAAAITLIANVACMDTGNAPEGTNIPMMTTAVRATTTPSSAVSSTATGATLSTGSCSVCGLSSGFAAVYSLASTFVVAGKAADANSCVINAVAVSNTISDLSSGNYFYLSSGNQKHKVLIQKNGDTVAKFQVFTCTGGTQSQYMSGSNTSTLVRFQLRSKSISSVFFSMDLSGVYQGGVWASKTLNAATTSASQYSQFNIVQSPNYLDITAAVDKGTLGTLDAGDLRFISRVELLGSNAKTYELGTGSIRLASGVGAATVSNWNGDTGLPGFGDVVLDVAVGAGTLPTIPLVGLAGNFTASETWDCSTSGETDVSATLASNSAYTKSLQACLDGLQ